MLDYLLNINPKLECPKIIELSTYTNILAQTTIDGLTGVFNRRYFDNQLLNEMNRAKRHNHTVSLLMMDIDDFKKINDTHGHVAGDCVLKEFTGILKNHLRSEDMAARYGGEEFVIILPHTDIEGAKIFSERLLEKARKYIYPGEIKVTFSGGIANYPHHGLTKEQILEVADKGLYESKLRGKNQITVLQEERRDNTRYSIQDELFFTTNSDKKYHATMKNISLSGLSGECGTALQPGDLISLQFHNPEDRSEWDIIAQIIWVNKLKQIEELNFGARYKSEGRNELYKLVTQFVPANHTSSRET